MSLKSKRSMLWTKVCQWGWILCLLSCRIPPQQLDTIAEKIWDNECKRSEEGLVSWNVGEEFASLGIGHFIWYPENQTGPFLETFPSLVQFLNAKEVLVPEWLVSASGCPWKSREEFLSHQKDPRLKALRQLLAQTVSLQAQFILQRFERTLASWSKELPSAKQQHLDAQLKRLLHTANGPYLLLDYLNFKGEGTHPKERYQGKGWGLLQVLEAMEGNTQDPIREFIHAAKGVLKQRVDNSPPERNEKRWLPGWYSRLETYGR